MTKKTDKVHLSSEHGAASSEKRWLALYAGVLLFLVLQILLYAWFTETWK